MSFLIYIIYIYIYLADVMILFCIVNLFQSVLFLNSGLEMNVFLNQIHGVIMVSCAIDLKEKKMEPSFANKYIYLQDIM